MIYGMSVETAQRYIKCVDKINDTVNKIHALAYMISVFSVVEHGAIDINPHVVGYLGQEIAQEALRISEILDDYFVSRAEIMVELKAYKYEE
jgi:hypothetical protein